MPVLLLYDYGVSELGWVIDDCPWIFQLPVLLEKQGRLWSTVHSTASTDLSPLPAPDPTTSAFLKSSDLCLPKFPEEHLKIV